MFNFLSGVTGRTEVEAGLEAIATELAAVASQGLAVGLTAGLVIVGLAVAVIVTVNNYYVCGGYGAATIAPIIFGYCYGIIFDIIAALAAVVIATNENNGAVFAPNTTNVNCDFCFKKEREEGIEFGTGVPFNNNL